MSPDAPESKNFSQENFTYTPRIRDMDSKERPRERLNSMGATALSNVELLAILLRTGSKKNSVLQIAGELLKTFRGSLSALLQASIEEICTIHGIGKDKAITLIAAFELARRARQEKILELQTFQTAGQIAELLRELFSGETREKLKIIHLNKRFQIMRIEDASDGALGEISIYVTEIFRKAILMRSSYLILSHNHPSGNPTPSIDDIKTTQDLVRCGKLLKIEILDHIIIGTRNTSDNFISMRDLGYIH